MTVGNKCYHNLMEIHLNGYTRILRICKGYIMLNLSIASCLTVRVKFHLGREAKINPSPLSHISWLAMKLNIRSHAKLGKLSMKTGDELVFAGGRRSVMLTKICVQCSNITKPMYSTDITWCIKKTDG